MKKTMIAALAAVLALGLSGCAENKIPNLTGEQVQMVGEYAAITMMRYDANHRSRLVDYTAMMATPEPEVIPEAPEAEPTPAAGMDPVDDTPVVGENGQAGNGHTIEGTLALPEGITVTLAGYSLYDNYPEDEGYFGVAAAQGKKLLVLRLTVSNSSGQDQAIDLLDSEAQFRISVNGEYTRKALPTILENDLSTFQGTVPAGGSADTVLIIEVEKETAENISSLSLELKNDSKACTIQIL